MNDKAIRQDLQASPRRDVVIGGYVNCFTLYEALYGAAHDSETVFGMQIDANCTGGLVDGGRSLSGANGIAGNWAHLPLPTQSPMNWTGMFAGVGVPVAWKRLFRLKVSIRITIKSPKAAIQRPLLPV